MGQQLAARGNVPCSTIPSSPPPNALPLGYPVIIVPTGIDSDDFPVSMSLHHTQWQEGTLIKWASTIEDLIHHMYGWRPTPKYRSYMSKNVPNYPIQHSVTQWRDR